MILIISIPLISSIIIGINGWKIGEKGKKIIIKTTLIISNIIMIKYLYNNIKYNEERRISIEWITIGIERIENMGLIIERKNIIMMSLIIIISSIVIIYSIWYMGEGNNRFIITLLLFTLSMLLFTLGSNYFIIFIGWELIGIISYMLINYWNRNINNNKSGLKAIIINKIGDIFFIIFLGKYIYNIGDLQINNFIFLDSNLLFFLFFAALAKSAQLFFHVWLGDAMAGPTPVSALLHAATMVTAGVYLMIKIINIRMEEGIIIALLTIILGGLSAINQYDIKKIIAYSTVSQIGYMLYSVTINKNELGLYHLITHGYFKALLFLTAGIIIHNNYNEQDIRKLGNLIYYYPNSYLFMLFGSLSIISFPFTSGFYSKEPILYSGYINNIFITLLLNIGALLTIIYSINLLYHVFIKNNKIFPLKEIHSSYFIFLPLLFGSLFIGYLSQDFILLNNLFLELNYIPYYIHILPFISIIIGLFFILLYNNGEPNKRHIILNKRFYFDSLYNYFSYFFLFSSSLFLFKFLDKGFLEYIGPIGLYRKIILISRNMRKSKIMINTIFLLFILLFIFYFFLEVLKINL